MNTQVTEMQSIKAAVFKSSEHLPIGIELPENFPVVLSASQRSEIEAELDGVNLKSVQLGDIPKIGADTEQNLHRSLSKFLERIDKNGQPKIFELVEQLSQAVDAEQLDVVADQILNARPTIWQTIQGFFSKQSLQRAINQAHLELRELASGKSKNLCNTIGEMERDLDTEKARLGEEIQSLENLKNEYQQQFMKYAMSTAVLYTLLARGRSELSEAESSSATNRDVITDLQDKLQVLESRTLAMEGTLTRLPSDQLVIRQLQQAGITTLQETTTTAASRFASIKMTLLTLHGALVTKGVQQIAQQGAQLDASLLKVRGKLMKDVVGSAVSAAGENRTAQANQLRDIVKDTQELVRTVNEARARSQASFANARDVFAQARNDLAEIGAVIRPDKGLPIT